MDFLNQILHYPLDELPFVFIALVIAFSVHEFAHAYSAYLFGDPTAKDEGRVTLNPRKHLDVFGTILIFIVGFGWAKPVPVNRGNFKYPRVMGIIVSALGPISNFILGVIALVIIVLLEVNGFDQHASGVNEAIMVFLNHFLTLNIVLTVFNLLPLPPLDGFRIVEDLMPQKLRIRMQSYTQWGVFIFLLIVFIEPLRKITLDPLFTAAYHITVQIYLILHSIAA